MSAAKAGLPSRHVTEGTFAAPQRAFYYSMGLGAEDIHRPLVGVVAAWDGGAAAADAPLLVAEAAEAGVTAGAATPRRFATVADAASLIGRELVADSVELTVRGHSYDALVGVAADANALAGLAMVACRLDVPARLVPLVSPALGTGPDEAALATALRTLGLAVDATGTLGDLSQAAREAGKGVAALVGARTPARAGIDGGALHAAAGQLAERPHLLVHLAAVAHECGLDLGVGDLVPAGSAPAARWLPAGDSAPGALVTGPAARGTVRVVEPEDARAAAGDGVAVVVCHRGPATGPGFLEVSPGPGGLLLTDGWAAPTEGTAVVSGLESVALLRDGDTVEVTAGAIGLPPLDDRTPTDPPQRPLPRSWSKYARMVGPVEGGAVTHPGAAAEVIRYAEL